MSWMKHLAVLVDLVARVSNMKKVVGIVLIVILIIMCWFLFRPRAVSQTNENVAIVGEIQIKERPVSSVASDSPAEPEESDVKDNSRFTSQFFKTISDTIVYDHVDTVATPPSITGDADVDVYLQKKAENRGYQLRHQADESRLVDVGDKKLQPEAAESLSALQAAAKKERMTITFVSGYRSVADQRRIVLNKLGTYDKDALLAGKRDTNIDDILVVSSMPGYSKHHTGYTVDIACGNYDLSNAFMQTPCYQWLSHDNFANARAYNFVPSYPKGIANQGPNPESWEFIWVPDSYLE